MNRMEMNADEILANLAYGSPRREQAAAAFLELLRKLAASELFEPVSRQSWTIPEEDREEMAGRACIRILERSPVPVVGKSAAECYRFVETTLVRIWIDETRKRASAVAKREALTSALAPGSDGHDEGLEKSRALLGRVVDDMLARKPSDRLARAWKQIQRLVYDQEDMDAVLASDEGICASSTDDERRRARDRILTTHYLFRNALVEAVADMEHRKSLSVDDAEFCRQAIRRFLKRNQRRA